MSGENLDVRKIESDVDSDDDDDEIIQAFKNEEFADRILREEVRKQMEEDEMIAKEVAVIDSQKYMKTLRDDKEDNNDMEPEKVEIKQLEVDNEEEFDEVHNIIEAVGGVTLENKSKKVVKHGSSEHLEKAPEFDEVHNLFEVVAGKTLGENDGKKNMDQKKKEIGKVGEKSLMLDSEHVRKIRKRNHKVGEKSQHLPHKSQELEFRELKEEYFQEHLENQDKTDADYALALMIQEKEALEVLEAEERTALEMYEQPGHEVYYS